MLCPPARLMILSNSFNAGGAQRFTEALLKGLDRRRVRPLLVLLQDDMGFALPADVPVEVLDYHRPADIAKAVWRLRRLMQKWSPDVVLGAGTSVNVVIGPALLSMRRRPAWIARVDTSPYRRDLRFRNFLLGWLYPMAGRVVAISLGLQKALAARYPKQKGKFAFIYNPVDFNALDARLKDKPPPTALGPGPLVLTAGRAHKIKRQDLLLEAVAKILPTTALDLVICGDGPLLAWLKTRARGLGIEKHVHFKGYCANPFALMAVADLFVLSSDAEGLSNALIEAQGLGLCAVSTRCDFGPAEIIDDGRTGLLVKTGDAGQLATAIGKLLADNALRGRMGAAARQRARQRFDFSKRCRQWEDMIISVAYGDKV